MPLVARCDRKNFHTRDVKSTCENKLDIDFNGGKEFNRWFWLNGKKKKNNNTKRPKTTIPRKTYKSMAVQLGLNAEQFDDLLECPLKKKWYEQIVS